jgi:hypothetical protein
VVASSVEVAAGNQREAAARAYVLHVGRQRARLLRQRPGAPRNLIAQETNPTAIAASLRKLRTPLGEGYEMDNLRESWFITVEQRPANPSLDRLSSLSLASSHRPRSRSRLRRLRLSPSQLHRLLRSQPLN